MWLFVFSLHEHRPFTKAFFSTMIQIEKQQVRDYWQAGSPVHLHVISQDRAY